MPTRWSGAERASIKQGGGDLRTKKQSSVKAQKRIAKKVSRKLKG